MNDILEEMRIQVAKEAVWQSKVESVLRWLQKGLPMEDIAYCIDLPIEQVEAIATEHQLDIKREPIQQ